MAKANQAVTKNGKRTSDRQTARNSTTIKVKLHNHYPIGKTGYIPRSVGKIL